MRPGPTSTVPVAELTFVSLKRDSAICTPVVEENPGFEACPPPFTAKGVLLDPKIRSYEIARSCKADVTEQDILTILLTSSAEPGSTEQADASELEVEKCETSDEY